MMRPSIAKSAMLPFLLLACSPSAGTDQSPSVTASGAADPNTEQPTRTASPGAVDLTGKWRVGALDGKRIDPENRIELTGSAGTIWWEPGCAGQNRQYAIKGSQFKTVPPTHALTAVCEIGFAPEVPQTFQAMDAADTIARTADNGILISGGGRSVLLYSQ